MRNVFIIWLAIVGMAAAIGSTFWFIELGAHAHVPFPLIMFACLVWVSTAFLLIVAACERFMLDNQ